jgi:hypothetical protein
MQAMHAHSIEAKRKLPTGIKEVNHTLKRIVHSIVEA